MVIPKLRLPTILAVLSFLFPQATVHGAGVPISGSVTARGGSSPAGARATLAPVPTSYEGGLGQLPGVPDSEQTAGKPVAAVAVREDGTFTLQAPEEGLWLVGIKASGFIPIQYGPVAVVEPTELPPAVLVRDAGSRVQVEDPTGRPVAGATVFAGSLNRELWQELTPDLWSVRPRVALTGEDGEARLARAAEESLALGVAAPGLPLGHVRELADKPLTLRLPRGVTYRLRVLNQAGKPVSGVLVRVGRNALPVTVTAPDGTAEVVGMPEEEVEVRLLTPGGQRLDGILGAVEAPSKAPTVFELPPPLKVSGRVLDAASREPLAGAWVWPGHDPGLAVRTDQRGRYRLPALASPSFWLRARMAGYLPRNKRCPLREGSPERSLTLAIEPAARLAGWVTDREGTPMPGVEVLASPRTDFRSGPSGEAPPLGRALSDHQGHFSVAGLQPGEEYELVASRTGFAPARTTVSGLAPLPSGNEVRITLDPGRRVVGRVEDLEGNPLSQVMVEVSPSSPRSARSFRQVEDSSIGYTDAAGGFSIPHVPSGLMDLRFNRTGLAPLVRRGVEIKAGEGPFDLGTVTLVAGAVLRGRVTDSEDAPISGAEVVLLKEYRLLELAAAGAPMRGRPAAISDSRGWFEVRDLPPGHPVHLLIRRAGYRQAGLEGVPVPTPDPLEVVLEPTARLSGEVLSESGSPVSGAQVRGLAQDPVAAAVTSHYAFLHQIANTYTDWLGRFVLEGMSEGKVRLEVSAEGYVAPEPAELKIPADGDLTGVRLVLRRGAVLEGRVTDETGQPVTGGRVRAGGAVGLSDADGHYRLEGLSLGLQKVVVVHQAHPQLRDQLEVEPGSNLLDLVLESACSVEGRVVDATGAGLEGVRLYLLREARDPYGTLSVEDGSFRFPAVAPGEYILKGEKQGYAPSSVTARVIEGSVHDLTLTLDEGVRITGRLLGLQDEELAEVEVFARREEGGRHYAHVLSDGSYELAHLEPGFWEIRGELAAGSRQATEQRFLEEGVEQAEVDLDFGAGLTLAGQVQYRGSPLAGADVTVRGLDLSVSRATVSSYEGSFSLRGLQPGSYRLQVVQRTEHINHSQDLQISSDREIIVEIDSAVVQGRVVDGASGQVLPDALVTFERLGSASREAAFLVSISTEDDGGFVLPRLTAGTYLVRAQKDGYIQVEELLELAPGVPHGELELVLRPAGGLEVVVRLDSGEVPSMATLGVITGEDQVPFLESRNLDADGRAHFRSLPPGTWLLAVSAPGAAARTVQATIPGDPLEFVLPRAGHLTVTVPGLAERGQIGSLRLADPRGHPFQALAQGSFRQAWPVLMGTATVTNLPTGAWHAVVTSSSGKQWAEWVRVLPGEHTHLLLEE